MTNKMLRILAATVILLLAGTATSISVFEECNSTMPFQFCSFYNGAARNPCPSGETCSLCSSAGTGGLYEGCVCTRRCQTDAQCSRSYPNSPVTPICSSSGFCLTPVTPALSSTACDDGNPRTLDFGIDIEASSSAQTLQFGFASCGPGAGSCACAHVCTPSTACSSLNGQLAYVNPAASYNLVTGQFQPPGNDAALCSSDSVAQSATPLCVRACPVPEPAPVDPRTCTPTCAASPIPGTLSFALLDADEYPLETEVGIVCACTGNAQCNDNDPTTIDRCALLQDIEPRCADGGVYDGDCLSGVCVHSCVMETTPRRVSEAVVAGIVGAVCLCCCCVGAIAAVVYIVRHKPRSETMARRRTRMAQKQEDDDDEKPFDSGSVYVRRLTENPFYVPSDENIAFF